MIKIKTNKGYFDLSNDISIRIEETSPVLNDRGSQSVPITLPPTATNKQLAGYANRIDVANKPFQDSSCEIVSGVYHRRGVVNVCSSGATDGFEINIGLDNAEAYSSWNSKKLKELSNLPTIQYSSIEELIQHLGLVLEGKLEADYTLFQVVVANESLSETKDVLFEGLTNKREVHTYYPEILNQIETIENVGPPTTALIWRSRYEYFLVGGTLTRVSLPTGYGISPFLYVWKVLEYIFAEYGYTIDENIFKTNFELARLVVLNNVMDTCTKNFIRYSDIMPDCTIEEFINSLYVRFGFVYNMNSTTKRVKFIFLKDLLSMPAKFDLSQKISTPPKISYSASKQIVLGCGTSLTGSSAKNDRYEDYLAANKGKISIVSKVQDSTVNAPYYYEYPTGRIFTKEERNKTIWGGEISFCPTNFNWDRQTENLEEETLTSDDEAIFMGFAGRYGEMFLSPYFLAGGAYHNSSLMSTSMKIEKKEEKTPLAFAFAFNSYFDKDYPFGSIFPRTSSGLAVETTKGFHKLNLLFQFKNGLFDRFWKDYDAILRHSNNTIEITANLSTAEIMRVDSLAPIMLRGQMFLLDSFGYSLPANKAIETEFTLRSLKLLKPYDLVREQYITEISENNYYWLLDIVNRDSFIQTQSAWFRTNIEEVGAYGWTFTSAQIYVETWIKKPYSAINLDLYPPSSTNATPISGPAQMSIRWLVRGIDEYKEPVGIYVTRMHDITGIWLPREYK